MSNETYDPLLYKPAYTVDDLQSSPDSDRFDNATEARRLLEEQVENGGNLTADIVAMGAELGGGIFLGHKLHRSAKFAQVAKYANRGISTLRTAKTVGAVAAIPTDPVTAAPTAIGGLATYAVAEAGIWGLSNIAGQTIRKAYGVQDSYSVGEALGASVFGLSIVNNKADKIFGLGEASLASLKLWKTKDYAVKGGKMFISGAALGVAETAVRQELQIQLNERENREIVEYYWAAGLGGAFNTGFGLIASTGSWGRGVADKTIKGAKKNIKTELKALKTEQQRLTSIGKRGEAKKAAKLIQEKEQALLALDDLQESLDEADKALSALDTPEGQDKVKSNQAPEDPTANIPDKPSLDTTYEGLPPSSNSAKTQIATTINSYKKAANILNENSGGRTLDYGAGLGKGSEAIGSDSYEPFPEEGFTPTYKSNEELANESYEKIINLSVLNVVPPDVREGIVKEIGRVLSVNGEAIISTRTVSDVKKAKTKIPSSIEDNAFIVKGPKGDTYQKGFSQQELVDYVKQVLGDDFEVTANPKAEDGTTINGSVVKVKKLKSQSEIARPKPQKALTNEELEDLGKDFLESNGLTLNDFVISKVDGEPTLRAVSGAGGGGRTPTLIELAAYRSKVSDAQSGIKTGVLKPTFVLSRQSETSFYDFIDLLKTKGQEIIDYGPDTQKYLDLLFKLQERYPEAFKASYAKTEGSRGQFSYRADRSIRPMMRVSKGDKISTIVHEAVHAVTSRTLFNALPNSVLSKKGDAYLDALREARKNGKIKSKGAEDLVDLYLEVIERLGLHKSVRKNLNKPDPLTHSGYNYGLGDLDEFLAEALTAPVFQQELASMTIKRKGQSAWSEFKRLVGRLLGFDVPPQSALSETLSLFTKVARENEIIEKSYNKRNELRINEVLGKITPTERAAALKESREAKEKDIEALEAEDVGEILPPDVSEPALKNLPEYDKELFGEGIETKKFKLNKETGYYEGEIDGEPYTYHKSQFNKPTEAKVRAAASREHLQKKANEAYEAVRKGERIESVLERLNKEGTSGYRITIQELDPLLSNPRSLASSKEIDVTDADGNAIPYNDLPDDLQREIRLFLKYHSGRYNNPAQEPDLNTSAEAVFDERQLLIDFEQDPRITELRELEKQLDKINRSNSTVLFPAIERAVKTLDRESKDNLTNVLTSLSVSDELSLEDLTEFIREIRFMRRMNKVRDVAETTGGRIVQAGRRDAESFATSATYSIRAYKEDEALAQMEDLVERLIKGKGTDEDDSLSELLSDFLDDFFDDEPTEFFEPFNTQEQVKLLDAEEADADDLVIEEGSVPEGEEPSGAEGEEPKPKKPRKKKNNSLTLEEKLTKQEEKLKRKIEELEKRLDASRKEFVADRPINEQDNTDLGLEDELIDAGEQPPKPKKEKDPRVARLEKLLSFYTKAKSELNVLIELKRKRARLAALEGSGDVTLIKKELDSGIKGPKSPTSADEVRKDIATIRKRMRQRLNDIERAQKQIEAEASLDASARVNQKLQKRKEQLQKRLDAYRIRFRERAPTDDLGTREARRIEDEQTKELENQIKFYQRAEKEAAETERLSAELARLADIEGRSVVSELEATTKRKPKGPTSPSKVKDLRKKINESKARMRRKLRDLEKARIQMQRAELFAEMEQYFYKSLETDVSSRFTRFLMKSRQLRQLALIDQLPSVLAGVPTGGFGLTKQPFRIPTKFFSGVLTGKGFSVAKQLASIEFKAMGFMFSDLKDLTKSFKRSFLLNESVTDNMAGKMEIEGQTAVPRGIHAMVLKSRQSAARKARAAATVSEKFTGAVRRGSLTQILSYGVRGIIGVDDVFKRMMLKGRMYSEASRRALLEFPDNPTKMKKRAQEIYETGWRDQDGLPVLADTLDFYDEIDNVRTELLFASNADNLEDTAESMIEPFIRGVQNMAKDAGFTGTLINAFVPFFGVATRGVYRSGRLVLFPLLAGRALRTPYNKKIRALRAQKLKIEDIIQKDYLNDNEKLKLAKDLKLKQDRIESMEIRELKYKEELLTDIMVGASLATTGLLAGAAGSMTGALSFLSNEERKRLRGLKDPVNQFRMFGMDYKAALPVTFPLAIYADVGAFLRLRRVQAQTGQPLLDPELTLLDVMQRSFLSLVKELPLSSGINTFEDLTSEDNKGFTESLQRLLNSYIPVPAQVRKIINTITVDGKVADLKGGSYYERTAYQLLGVGPMNYQTDAFGYDLETDANWVTDTVWRQAPRFNSNTPLDQKTARTYEEFERILTTDSQMQISKKPKNLVTGVTMSDWVDEEGTKLSYYFNQELKKTRLPRAGKSLTMIEAVDALIKSPSFKKKYAEGWKQSKTNPDLIENEGLEMLNDLMRRYYDKARNNIVRSKLTLARFVNEDNIRLNTFMEQTVTEINNARPNAKPFSLQDFYDL